MHSVFALPAISANSDQVQLILHVHLVSTVQLPLSSNTNTHVQLENLPPPKAPTLPVAQTAQAVIIAEKALQLTVIKLFVQRKAMCVLLVPPLERHVQLVKQLRMESTVLHALQTVSVLRVFRKPVVRQVTLLLLV